MIYLNDANILREKSKLLKLLKRVGPKVDTSKVLITGNKLTYKGTLEIHMSEDLWEISNLGYTFDTLKGDMLIVGGTAEEFRGLPCIITGDLTFFYSSIKRFSKESVYVKGDLIIIGKNIESLENLPKVGGSIICYGHKLKSLKGLPKVINGNLDLSGNMIKELIGFSDIKVKGDLDLSSNQIESLIGLPQVSGSIKLSNNPIKDLRGLPEIVNGDLDLEGCDIKRSDIHSKTKGYLSL